MSKATASARSFLHNYRGYVAPFMAAFLLYLLSTTAVQTISGVGLQSALAVSMVSGLAMTLFVFKVIPHFWAFENYSKFGDDPDLRLRRPFGWDLLYGPLRHSKEDSSGDSGSDKHGPEDDKDNESGVQDEAFKKRLRANQIAAARRAEQGTHDKVIRTAAIVVLYTAVYYFIASEIGSIIRELFGANSGNIQSAAMFGGGAEIKFNSFRDLFIIDIEIVIAVWAVLILILPRWITLLLLIGASMMRIVFLVFGPMASMWMLNMGQLPFFYGLMMVFMFGSIMYPFLQAIKYYEPGEGGWGTPSGSMRGQPEVRAAVKLELDKFRDYVLGVNTKVRPTRGMIFEGPPGTGKTLYAKEIATEFNVPFVITDGAAFSGAPMVNVMMAIVKWRTNRLAKKFGGAIFFVDEADTLLARRSGMGAGAPVANTIKDVWDMYDYDQFGVMTSCGITFDNEAVRERAWRLKSPADLKQPHPYTHPFFMPVGMGGGGGGAIFPFLTWLQGAGSPPFWATMKRRIVNEILSGLFIPAYVPLPFIHEKKVLFIGNLPDGFLLRLSPPKLEDPLIMFIGATNRYWMLDDAITRPGRMGTVVHFKTPDLNSRKDIIDLYLSRAAEKDLILPTLLEDERLSEFARATSGMSPAQIEETIKKAYDVRGTHVKRLKRIKERLDADTSTDSIIEKLEKLTKDDKKYWLRFDGETDKPDWDDDRVDMQSLLEARNEIAWGHRNPGLTTEVHKHQTAYHEYWGHFIPLWATLGDVMRPSTLSVLPRGQALGMVAHVPIEERDPKMQRFYEGLMRVQVGSTLAERFFEKENAPGVASDLNAATRTVTFIAGKAAMVHYAFNDAEEEARYAAIGQSLISIPEPELALMNPTVQGFIEKVLANPFKGREAAVFLGKAYVDVYRLIRATWQNPIHREFHEKAVQQLIDLDEISGKRLEDLWTQLGDHVVTWDEMSPEQRSAWPDADGGKSFRAKNPFYYPNEKSEAEDLAEVAS